MLNFDHKAPVFKNKVLQAMLNEDGFTVVDFLNEAELKRLYEAYTRLHPDAVNGFYISVFSKDPDYRQAVDNIILAEMQRGIDHYFHNYKVHCGTFIIKGNDEKSTMKIHQDMTLVNESVYTSINIWIPLVDINKENGAIALLPRSHRLFKTYRGSSLPNIYDGMEASLYKIMKPLSLKAGQAVIFDQSIIHFSQVNQSGQPRPVVNTLIMHRDADIQTCYRDKNSSRQEIELFEQAPDFMVNFHNFGHDMFSRPAIGKSIGFVPYNFPKITPALLEQEYGLKDTATATVQVTRPEPKPFFELFKKIFSGT